MNQSKTQALVLILTTSLLLLTMATNGLPVARADSSSMTKLQTGLVASDSLTMGNTAYWRFHGSAVAQNASAAYSENSNGLMVGVKAATPGVWAGYFAVSPLTQAEVFHAVLTLPNSTIPSYSANTGLYVQSSSAEINGVACGAGVNQEGYYWMAEWGEGNSNYVTQFHVLYFQWWWPDAPLTRDCTIVTNGQNLLKIYFDNQLVYSNNTMNLQMQSPFNSFLEEQSTYPNSLVFGLFKDYYATTSDMVTVIGAQPGAVTEILGSNNTILAKATVGQNGEALMDVGQYHMPITGLEELYDSNHNVIATTGSSSIWGGDIYGANEPSTSQLTISSEGTNGVPILGMYTILMQNQNVDATGFSPAIFNLTNSLQYTVEVQDYGSLVFDHWLDSGSTYRDRSVSISADTLLTAVYRNMSAPPPSGQSIINVSTVNSTGQQITGYYTTLWQNGVQLQSCFSQCSFNVNNGETYGVAVSDYGGVSFNHWSDGTTTRLDTVAVGSNSTTVNLTAYYTP
ncbi:MAG: hypothetical protein M1587_04400 [Thaumarchaeota archaeon]|nr:hypothetical protein [Nitrososphaerota archaeon]